MDAPNATAGLDTATIAAQVEGIVFSGAYEYTLALLADRLIDR